VFVNEPEIVEPLPLAAMPCKFPVLIVPLSLVQLNAVPATEFGFVILIVVMAEPEHAVWLVGEALTVGVGFIVIVVLDTPITCGTSLDTILILYPEPLGVVIGISTTTDLLFPVVVVVPRVVGEVKLPDELLN
jgi:hypothetical protein